MDWPKPAAAEDPPPLVPLDEELIIEHRGSGALDVRLIDYHSADYPLVMGEVSMLELGSLPPPTRNNARYVRMRPSAPLIPGHTYSVLVLGPTGTTTTSSVTFTATTAPGAAPLPAPVATLYFGQTGQAPAPADACGNLANEVTHAVVSLPITDQPFFLRFRPIFGAETSGWSEPASEIFFTSNVNPRKVQFTAFGADRGSACAEITLRTVTGSVSAASVTCDLSKCDTLTNIRSVRSVQDWERARGQPCTVVPPDAGVPPPEPDAGAEPEIDGGSSGQGSDGSAVRTDAGRVVRRDAGVDGGDSADPAEPTTGCSAIGGQRRGSDGWSFLVSISAGLALAWLGRRRPQS
ncbi:MAG: hypothetical protein U1E65_25930 [Myxococcota bacterium]